jgi:hypothetical protein
MLDTTMIQTRGFKNTPGGFELRLRLPYYRGLWTGLLEGAAVTVDGEVFAPEDVHWTIGEVSGSLAELRASPTARWPVDVPAVLALRRGSPLSIGFHDVSVELAVQMSYIPEELQPTLWTEQRRLVVAR